MTTAAAAAVDSRAPGWVSAKTFGLPGATFPVPSRWSAAPQHGGIEHHVTRPRPGRFRLGNGSSFAALAWSICHPTCHEFHSVCEFPVHTTEKLEIRAVCRQGETRPDQVHFVRNAIAAVACDTVTCCIRCIPAIPCRLSISARRIIGAHQRIAAAPTQTRSHQTDVTVVTRVRAGPGACQGF
jgi:hypothetical protein